MSEFYEANATMHKPWKKILCVILSLIMAFGTFITITFGNSKFQKWLGVKAMLSAYASEFVDTSTAVAVNEEAMLENNYLIDLENKDGSNTAYIFSEPISFEDENGNLKTKDIYVEKQKNSSLKSQGYEYANGQNDYRINFSKDKNKGILVQFDGFSYSLAPSSIYDVEGEKSSSVVMDEEFETFEYTGAFGAGTNLKFYPQLNGVKDEIVLDSNVGKNTFSFELNAENCTALLNDDGTVSLVDSENNTVQVFQAPFAYDSEYVTGINDEHYSNCAYTLEEIESGNYILTVTVDDEWLSSETTAYPVIIDPTTSHISNMYDLPIHKNRTTTGATVDVNAVGLSAEYTKSCSLIKFQKPSEIKQYAKINSAYYYSRELTGRTSDFKCGVHQITGSWNENTVWSTCPTYYTNYSTYKNINNTTGDIGGNQYWYNFDIKSLVQAWYTGTTNYGFMLRYDGDSTAYNLRTFAHLEYSTSTWRPYTVINYANDETAPTVTSVTGNPTAWTRGNVTLTVNGAADNSGGVGLHSTPYSFSTTKDSYSWQAGNTKTFSSNCKVYVYVRDAYNNISLVSTQTISKIDKTAPTNTNVTGNPTSWTNSNITLTVNGAADAASGLNSTAYSFSTASGTYSWQTGNTKSVSANGTYYIYIRDAVGNIKSAGSVEISKIDKAKPIISNVDISKNADTGKATVTITAEDALSGIAGYNFDGGNTYDTGRSKELDSLPNTISVAVMDNAGNIATEVSDAILPEFYDDGNLIGILNPNTDSNEELQYKIGDDGEWTDYTVPFAVPLGEESIVYARVGESEFVISKTVTPDTSSIGTYTESNTDFSLAYKNVSFDFARTYDSTDKKWFFATDSNVTVINDYVINAILPDSTELTFIRTADDTYINEINGYTLSVTESGYVIQIDDINYYYGTDGKLSSVSNKYDDTISIAKTASSITITDGANRVYKLALDSNGNIISATDPANNVITYTYDDNNNLTNVVDQAGVIISQYVYTNGVLTKSMDKTINYGDDGRVASYVYDSGAYLTYTYDDENKTVSTESSTETTTSQTYNDALMLVSSTDEDGNTTEYTYDEYYCTLTETSGGTTITYTYDDNGNLLSEVSDDEEAENTYYVYDSNGNIIRQRTGEDYTYYVYNENDELTLSATLKEDYTGDIPEIYNSDLTCFDTVSYTYNTDGTLQQTVDSKENETVTYIYDSYGYSEKVTTLTVENGTSTIGTVDYTYDIMGNLLTSVSGDETSSYIYDNAGRTLLANEKGDCTRTIYDNLGRVIQEIGPEDYVSSNDGLPNKNTYSDTNAGHTYEYDDNNRLIKEINRLGKVSEYSYHSNGEKSYEKFDIYEFFYNEHSDITEIKISDVTTVSYTYQNATKNDIEYRLVLESYANGDTIYNYYDIDTDNIVGISHNADGPFYVTYTYNDEGDLIEKENTDTGLKYVYDGDNVSVYKTSDNSLVQSYTSTETEANEETGAEAYTTVTENHFGTEYTSVSREKSVSYTAGDNTAEYSYQTTGTDEDERLSADSVKYNDSVILSSAYTYDDNGNVLSKSYGENNSIVNTYDDKDRITSTSYAGKTYNYTYDNDSQLTGVIGNNYTASYEYDNRGNITSKTVNGVTTSFTYANSGWKDQLVSVNGTELTYDANGNVLTYGDKEYTWNTGRNLAQITDGENTYSYTYDEDGIRTSKTVNGVTTYYHTKDGVILSQTDGTNTWYFQYDTNGAPLGFVWNGTQYLYMTNQMGDVIAILNTNGVVVGNYEYDAWGAVTLSDSNIANINPIRYRGYYYDAETEYYYLQSRYYDANICRFINSDSFLYAIIHKDNTSGVNLYIYCFNNSINYSDNNGFSAALAGSAFFYYFVNYVLPEIIAYGVLIISGVLLAYLLIKVVTDALNNSSSSGSSSNSPKKPKKPNNSKIQKILDKIPNSLKKNGKVDLSKFDKPVKGKTAWKSSNGWKIEKDTANHGGRVWKLFNKADKRIASLGADGSVLAD